MRCAALLLLAACSGATVDAQGNVGASSFESVVTLATSDPHQTLLVFSNNALSCEELAAGGVMGRPASALYVLLWDLAGGQQYPASFAKSYDIGSSGDAVSKAWFMRWDESCAVLEQTPANTGAFQINANGNGHLTGNFSAGFANGLLYGHFDVDLCPAIAQADPPLCL